MHPSLLPTLLLVGGCAMSDALPGSSTGLELEWASPLSADESLAVVEVPDLAQALERLRGKPGIEAAEPSITMTATAFPNDPMYPRQWNFEKVGAAAGWRVGGGRGVTVAVIDTGVSPVADLSGTTLLTGASFVPGAPRQPTTTATAPTSPAPSPRPPTTAWGWRAWPPTPGCCP